MASWCQNMWEINTCLTLIVFSALLVGVLVTDTKLSFLYDSSPSRALATSFLRFLYHTHTPLLCSSDQLVAEAATYTTQTHTPSAGYEPEIPANKRHGHITEFQEQN